MSDCIVHQQSISPAIPRAVPDYRKDTGKDHPYVEHNPESLENEYQRNEYHEAEYDDLSRTQARGSGRG